MCLGFTLESWINLAFYHLYGPVTWRAPTAIAALFSINLMVTVYAFPESPRWLVMKNRRVEAAKVVSVLRNQSEQSSEVQNEIAGIEISLEETGKRAVQLTDLLKMGEDKLLYRFLLCILLQFYQQMS
jgi:hypothetical protein